LPDDPGDVDVSGDERGVAIIRPARLAAESVDQRAHRTRENGRGIDIDLRDRVVDPFAPTEHRVKGRRVTSLGACTLADDDRMCRGTLALPACVGRDFGRGHRQRGKLCGRAGDDVDDLANAAWWKRVARATYR
jgi:hypothetical protein